MESIFLNDEERFLFEKELKAKGCVDLIRNNALNKIKDATEIIEDILNVIFNYYVCLCNDACEEEVSLEEKIQYLYFEEIISEDTKNKLLYLCDVLNNLYKLDGQNNV